MGNRGQIFREASAAHLGMTSKHVMSEKVLVTDGTNQSGLATAAFRLSQIVALGAPPKNGSARIRAHNVCMGPASQDIFDLICAFVRSSHLSGLFVRF